MVTITAPAFKGLTVTRDEYGSGVTVEGTPFDTFDIKRPDTAGRFGAMLASLTLYADPSIPPLVFDRYTGDMRAGDVRAIGLVRDTLKRDYPHYRPGGYRYA